MHQINELSTTSQPLILLPHFIFISFKEGGPSANAGLLGALHLLYNILTKNKTNTYNRWKYTDIQK